MTLTEEISAFTKDAYERFPAEYLQSFRNLIGRLAADRLGKDAPKVGAAFPDFTLQDDGSQPVQGSRYWNDKMIVLKFYRGGWCPYCNLELSALERYASDFAATNSLLFAIAPEKPVYQRETKAKAQAKFKFLWDQDNALARRLGIAFPVDESVRKVYAKLDLDLDAVNGEWILPIPATFVVNKGVVKYRSLDADYMTRQDPLDLLAALRELDASSAEIAAP